MIHFPAPLGCIQFAYLLREKIETEGMCIFANANAILLMCTSRSIKSRNDFRESHFWSGIGDRARCHAHAF